MIIDEIIYLDKIFSLEKKKKNAEHINITNISYWNPSDSYKKYMENYIELDCQQDIFDYVYTYDLNKVKRKQIIQKIGVLNPSESMCLLTTSGTNTILNTINFLKLHNYKKLAILMPSYFSVEKTCKLYHVTYENVALQYYNGKYNIPVEYLLKNNFDVVWITSPAYSTGISYDNSQIEVLKELISKKILIIADETLAMPEQILLSKIPIGDYFFSICSPHKPLFMNKIKFSALICPKKNDDFLEQWIDIIGGSLLSSNLVAVEHFLSNNFSHCVQATQKWYNNAIKEIYNIIQQFPNVQCNLNELSPYKTVYLNSPKKDLKDLNNINKLIDNYYVSYIPITFEHYSGFRFNLSLDLNELANALYRILDYYA